MVNDFDERRRSGIERPRVDVRVVLFTVRESRLWVALETDDSGAALPYGRPMPGEPLDGVAGRVLTDHIGANERYLEQLYTIASGEGADWAVTIAYIGLGLPSDMPPSLGGADWFDIRCLPTVSELDRNIVDYAILRLRAKLGYTTIAFHLLPRVFSLSELQEVYEAVLGRPLDKRNFRRRIQSEAFLEATGETRREGSHRPARLFQFRAAHDAETYLVPTWAERTDGESIDT
jgi:8-oxo-dGTP diphosphatase